MWLNVWLVKISLLIIVERSNTEEQQEASLAALRKLPIQRYEMAHDTVSGRVHYGVLAADAQKIFGNIYNERLSREELVPGAGGLTRAVVDSSILFMHGLSALRKLMNEIPQRIDETNLALQRVTSVASDLLNISTSISKENWQNAKQLHGEWTVVQAEIENAKTIIHKIEQAQKRTVALYEFQDKLRNGTQSLDYSMLLDRYDYRVNLKNLTLFEIDSLERTYGNFSEELILETELLILQHELDYNIHKEQLRRETALEVALEEEKRKAEAERLNEDMALRLIEARGEEQRQKLLQLLYAISSEFAGAAESLHSNPQRLWRLALGLVVLLAGCFMSRESAILCRNLLESYLSRPALVREASFSYFLSLRNVLWKSSEDRMQKNYNIFAGVILQNSIGPRLEALAHSLRGARRLHAPLRHIMLYGPPGTGKTLVARKLAAASGLDWAVASGGDIGPLGPSATTELHKLLNWARRSPRGLLLFLDEAEAALADRGRPNLSEDAVSALNAFLTHTSEPSYSVVLVLATNRPADIDAAVLDRIDEVIQLPLPDSHCRAQLLQLYFDQCFITDDARMRYSLFTSNRNKRPCIASDFDVSAHLNDLLPYTEGFSGREIAKLMLSIQAAVFSHDTKLVLTSSIWNEALRWKLAEVKPKKKDASI
uniref:AAA+ ATPase domain-containing protein n=1 Tax=Aureoumbra lagunensis TaxID=44058 RepID=A0A7S3JSF0_9STRA|mmetsp:Transcript_8620/g.13258  ORF Transcript_8620/g.13258 Transcript_8620/m.13258 type:complete len:658 (+) Transcript_8620:223-2196(+)|eukprot:CAMPEP_0197309330 /NCGR_PEP_ID=MMETSP0891-20130614/7894_1 /TAXON_ID=44058 ORGANISM="Aureoumbra lagunensis, Strain CCMP1510" /NCGR_SAMPLE_ID=MMETSP0891 /ASSEMBLY_ACC=CAM_ASM_000534 /LENGTH=657 /DNA_ID=CAMNT_0042794321 /DNA_START=172 /DNA_END=2148 /DNA_ORIENTATION=-